MILTIIKRGLSHWFNLIRSKLKYQFICLVLLGLFVPIALVVGLFFLFTTRAVEENNPAALPLLNTLFLGLAIALAIIMVGFFIALLSISRRLNRPLDALIESMRKAENGDFVPVPESGSINEVSQIALYYNRMISRFTQLIESIQLKNRQQWELEMQVLVGELQPRFLYNTLENIVWKSNQAGRPDISRIASKLSRLIRLTRYSNSPLVSLDLIIRQAILYIELQKARYKDRLRVKLEACSKEMLLLQSIRMLLYPCIENAIMHAMRPRGVPLHITIRVMCDDSALVFEISDDGLGMSAERLAEIRAFIYDNTPGRGFGLKNIHERLILYFGDEYGLSIDSEENTGTRVIIRTPIIEGAKGEQPKEASRAR
ncbi:MAG: histidine kinase [Treponema sp.]|jgi:two-component system sensor histidine kinase YesM|nr:histidine kinase [Treponema sp.]